MSDLGAVTAYIRGWTEHDAKAVLAVLTEDGTYQDPATDGPISGNALRACRAGLWQAIPDLTIELEHMGEPGPDRVAARTVTGYFDTADIPRQLDLDVIVQPRVIGSFRFGTSTMVQTGSTREPGAFSITYLEARDEAAALKVREGSRASMLDILEMEGFLAATSAKIGTRMVTISAWDSPEASRQVMKEGAHAAAMRGFYDGTLAKGGHTSVWTKHRINPVYMRCELSGHMNRDPAPGQPCHCGAPLPPRLPFW